MERLLYGGLLSGGIGAGAGLASGDPTDALKWGAGTFAGPWLASQLLTRAPTKAMLTRGLLNVSPATEKVLERLGASGGGLLGLSLAP